MPKSSYFSFLLILLIFGVISTGCAQIYDPVNWNSTIEKINEEEYKLIITASIDKGWHLYSQNVPEDGPIPTSFEFKGEGGSIEKKGSTQEEEGVTYHDPIFDMEIKFFAQQAKFSQNLLVSPDVRSLTVLIEYMVCDESKCLPPTEKRLEIPLPGRETQSVKNNQEKSTIPLVSKEPSRRNPISYKIFFIAFLSGFAALLTPCVFPMIPMTVSFFTKTSKDRRSGIKNSFLFGFSIIIIYVFLGSIISLAFGPGALNALSTNVWFNFIFFIVLLIFAASFLGAFELMLPQSWINRVDSMAGKGGYLGIFFMALALAIVSFSCTGPIVGTLLVEAAAGGNPSGPIIGMLGFSSAIALPFAFFAAFPTWLSSLPKSGSWLNSVKVVLGFLELALAFKFLSNADMVLDLNIFTRELFIAIWIAIFGAMTLYLFGKFKLPHDNPIQHLSVSRLLFGLMVLAFTIYMIPGLWGAPLKLISAFPPPPHYSESPYGVGYYQKSNIKTSNNELPDGAHLMPPHDFVVFNDYNTGLEYAQKVGKPIMLDFTGKACVNCRKMENNVWVDDSIKNILLNDVILISLYVDDKRPLHQKDIFDSELDPGTKVKYIGQKWSELQALKFGTNSQPYYVLLNHDEIKLNNPVGYTPDIDEYLNWLQEGIQKFESEKRVTEY